MATQRIDPLGMLAKPADAVLAHSSTTAAPQLETARVENTELGKCPICKVDMPIVMVGADAGSETAAYVCTEHCVCLPTKD